MTKIAVNFPAVTVGYERRRWKSGRLTLIGARTPALAQVITTVSGAAETTMRACLVEPVN